MALDRFLTLVLRWHNVGILLALWCRYFQSTCGSKILSTRQWSRKMSGMRVWAYKLHICILPVYILLSWAPIIFYSSSTKKSHSQSDFKSQSFREEKILKSLNGILLCIHHSYEICRFCVFYISLLSSFAERRL